MPSNYHYKKVSRFLKLKGMMFLGKSCNMWIQWDSKSGLLRELFTSSSKHHLFMLTMIIFRLSVKTNAIKAAFLYGDLEEETCIDCLPWMNDTGPDDASFLSKCIYGLVWAARQYWKNIVILNNIGFKGGNEDPCLMWWSDKAGLCFVAMYVDKNLDSGHPKAIQMLIQEFN